MRLFPYPSLTNNSFVFEYTRRLVAPRRTWVALLRDYILDTRMLSCYDFFVVDTFSNLAMCFLMREWPFGVNKCRIASSVVMCLGCFFFFGIR
jgi:hypothetical protein